MKSIISKIQRFSVGDGPGIRTTVFVKGCNLRCQWCHNPETIKPGVELAYYTNVCKMCMRCMDACDARSVVDGRIVIDRTLCVKCGKCAELCMHNALEMIGKEMSAQEIADIVIRDKSFYDNSAGGFTFSGGEPLLQKDFVKQVFKLNKQNGIHNALDTAFNVPYSIIEDVLEYVDLILLDIKSMDDDVHKVYTGVSNRLILENAKRVADRDMIVRIPMVENVNATMENIRSTAEFLTGFGGLKCVELLPYHDLGQSKNVAIGKQESEKFAAPNKENMLRFKECFETHGIKAIIK